MNKANLRAEVQEYLWIDDEVTASQQEVTDVFFELGLIPEELDIAKVVWDGGTNETASKQKIDQQWKSTGSYQLAAMMVPI